MAKTLTVTAQTEIAKKLGTKPIIVVEIDWFGNGNPIAYADKDYYEAIGKIIKISGLDTVTKFTGIGTVADISIELDDSDGTLKTIIDTTDIHKKPVSVYQSFEDISYDDKFLIFSGEIQTPIEWREGSRVLSLNTGTPVEDDEIGFSVEEGEFDWIAEEAINKAWPLCFGSVLRVPALRVKTQRKGQTLNRYHAISKGDLDDLETAAKAFKLSILTLSETSQLETGVEEYFSLINTYTENHIALYQTRDSVLAEVQDNEYYVDQFIETCYEIQYYEYYIAEYTEARTSAEDAMDNYGDDLDSTLIDIFNEEGSADPDPATLANLYDDYNTTKANYDAVVLQIASLTATIDSYNTQRLSYEAVKDNLILTLTALYIGTINIDGGEEWPQGVEFNAIINNMKLRGYMSGNSFIVQEALPLYTDIKFSSILNGTINQFYLEDDTIELKNLYCLVRLKSKDSTDRIPFYAIIRITDQIETKCYFEPIIWDIDVVTIVDGTTYFTCIPHTFTAEFTSIEAASPYVFGDWLTKSDYYRANNPYGVEVHEALIGTQNLRQSGWGFEVNDTLYVEDSYPDVYVANLIPSTEVKEVLAYRTDLDTGVRNLVPVPSRYYTVNLSDSLAEQNCTTITFNRPLRYYVDEGWEDQIYVTLISTEGPNTADIIQYLTETYTSLSVDVTTFASVNTSLTNYPSHFAILDRPNALKAIEEIAYQARCALSIRSDELFIYYLPTEPASLATLTETDVDINSMVLSFTDTESIVTKLTVNWKRDYAQEEPYTLVLRNNIPKYGIQESEETYYIYNIKSLVIKSATFWLLRKSHTWKKLKFATPLTHLQPDPQDCITLNFSETFIASSSIKTIIESVRYNPDSYQLEFEVWVPVRIGDMTQYIFAWPADVAVDVEYPSVYDEYAGGA